MRPAPHAWGNPVSPNPWVSQSRVPNPWGNSVGPNAWGNPVRPEFQTRREISWVQTHGFTPSRVPNPVQIHGVTDGRRRTSQKRRLHVLALGRRHVVAQLQLEPCEGLGASRHTRLPLGSQGFRPTLGFRLASLTTTRVVWWFGGAVKEGFSFAFYENQGCKSKSKPPIPTTNWGEAEKGGFPREENDHLACGWLIHADPHQLELMAFTCCPSTKNLSFFITS